MKTAILTSAVLFLSFASADAAQLSMAASATTEDGEGDAEWHYQTKTGTGKFVEGDNGKWTHRLSTGTVHRFVEVERSTDCIVIHDASRKVTIRLYERSCTIRHAGTNGEFQFLYKGRWVND